MTQFPLTCWLSFPCFLCGSLLEFCPQPHPHFSGLSSHTVVLLHCRGGMSSFLMFLSFSLAFMIKFQIFTWMWYLALIVSITQSPRKRISIGTCLNKLVCGHMWEDTVYHGWRHSLGRESCTRAEKSSWTQASQNELVCTLSFCSWLQVWCDWLLKFLLPGLFYELKPGLVTEMTSSPLSWLLSGYLIPTIDCS